MASYISVASVRRTCGIGSDQINDTDVENIILECEAQVERFLNTSFTPKQKIDVLDGNGTIRIFVDKNPLLSVREIKIDGDTENPAYLKIHKESGKIELDTTQSLTNSNFILGSRKVVVKYIYGWVEESSTSTTSSAAETSGTDVSIAVGSISGFADQDWVEIYGMDGYREVAQINATPSAGSIQVDKLIYSHESGSTIVKMEVNQIIKKLMNVISALAMVSRIVGQSYTDIVGYTMAEFSVQRGEPYTQWAETARQLIKERDEILSRIKPRSYVIV